MDIKTCTKCGAEKEMSHFYKHPRNKDGRSGACKDCKKAAVKAHREANADYYRAYDAKRYREDSKVRERIKRYQATEAGKASLNAARAKWVRENPEKRSAHRILNNRIRVGSIIKPDRCSSCGAGGRIEGHHHDYAKPLDVVWLCRKCHVQVHRDEDEGT